MFNLEGRRSGGDIYQFSTGNASAIKPFTMFKKLVPFSIITFLLTSAISSCTTVHGYQTGGPQGRETGNQPSTEWESKNSNTFFWGAVRQDVQIENCKLGDGSRLNIEEFKIQKNFGRIVATVLTLGIWEPMKVSWRCAKPKTNL